MPTPLPPDLGSGYFPGGSWAPKKRSKIDQNFDQFSVSILDRFGVVLGPQLGVIFVLFGAQVRPSSVQDPSWKLINIQNMNFHQMLRPLLPERRFGLQDGLQNAPRSAQDSSKRLLKTNFFALENRLQFGFALDPTLVDFGSQNASL